MRPNLSSTANGDGPAVRRIDNDDGSATIVIDFGARAADVHTDIVDETLLVVREQPDGEDSFEFDLPAGQARTFMKNGVLTVEVKE